jgi:hypothetical protein
LEQVRDQLLAPFEGALVVGYVEGWVSCEQAFEADYFGVQGHICLLKTILVGSID